MVRSLTEKVKRFTSHNGKIPLLLGGRGREGLVFKRPLSLSEDKLLVIISYTLRTQRKATTDISDTFGRQSSPLSFLEFLFVIPQTSYDRNCVNTSQERDYHLGGLWRKRLHLYHPKLIGWADENWYGSWKVKFQLTVLNFESRLVFLFFSFVSLNSWSDRWMFPCYFFFPRTVSKLFWEKRLARDSVFRGCSLDPAPSGSKINHVFAFPPRCCVRW